MTARLSGRVAGGLLRLSLRCGGGPCRARRPGSGWLCADQQG